MECCYMILQACTDRLLNREAEHAKVKIGWNSSQVACF